MTPAVTIIHITGGTAVQIAGLDTPLEQQVEALDTMGRLNAPGIPGAVRGEVWAAGKVVAATYFESHPASPPSQEMPEAGSKAHTLVPEGSTPSPATSSEPQEQGAGETGDAPEAPAPSDSPAAKKPPGRIK